MFRKGFVPALLAVFVLSGCVSTKNVKADLAALRSASPARLAVTARKKPDFAAVTAGKAAIGGLIGAVAMISAGNAIVRENDIEDPAGYISAELEKALSEALGTQAVDNGGKLASTSSARELAKLYPGADLLLDVQTINWSFGYFPTDWNNYRVVYSAKLRLIDVRTSTLRAEGFCARIPEKSDTAPSRDQLLADHAALLKSELKAAADYCIGEFRTKVLGG